MIRTAGPFLIPGPGPPIGLSAELPPPLVARTAPYVFDRDLTIDLADLARQEAFATSTGEMTVAPPIDKVIDRRFARTR